MIETQELSIVMSDGIMTIHTPDNGDYWDAMHSLAGARWDAGNHCWVAPVDPVTLEQVRSYMRQYFGRDDREPDNLPVDELIV